MVRYQKEMEEVVVTSLGVQREKRSLGYTIHTISGDDLAKVGNTNFASALYGKTTGM